MAFLAAYAFVPVFALVFALLAFEHVDFLFGSLDGAGEYFFDGVCLGEMLIGVLFGESGWVRRVCVVVGEEDGGVVLDFAFCEGGFAHF